MRYKRKLAFAFITVLILIVGLICYKIYLFVYEKDYQSLNAGNIDHIQAELRGKDSYSFAVVGNIRNSMRIFEKRIVPMIDDNGADFMISVGNSVYDGTEDKYRLLYRGLKKLGIPYVMAVGHNEIEDFGASKFYRHFGPYFFSFHLGNAYFIFLDSTGQTSWKWQLRWLEEELGRAGSYPFRFVFLNHSLFSLPGFESYNVHYVLDDGLGQKLKKMFHEYAVTAVFSSGIPAFHETISQGVRYIVTGGGGGLLLDRNKPYQIAEVTVGPKDISIRDITATSRLGSFREKIETLKLYLHSFFYISLFNSLLVLCLIALVAIKLYSLILRQEHLYRDFSIDESTVSHKSLKVAMFTNNYLPFIGGVPLSIDRLCRALVKHKDTVRIFAPAYPQPWEDPDDGSIVRCPILFHATIAGFPLANIFSGRLDSAFRDFACDLVHVHHPFWLGRKGMGLAKKYGLPVVFTYHTRLEHYTHYLPLPGTVLKNMVAHYIIKKFANRCDAIITPTPSTEEYLRNLGVSALIETIPTGISMEDYRYWTDEQIGMLRGKYVNEDELLLVTVSRMAKEKNLDFLIDGLVKVKERTKIPFKCLLIGEGPERERLEKKVADMGLGGQVIFTGNIPPRQVSLHYLAADLFVFASTSETQGMVLVEAMTGGCPVVAVRASGVHDVIRDGYNGFMVPESTESWAREVAVLIENRKLLSVMSQNSVAFANGYSEDKIAERILKLYQRVIILEKSKNS